MLAVSSTLVNASVNLTRHVAATHESESDRANVRFSDLLMCADLTDLRSTNRPNSTPDRLRFAGLILERLIFRGKKSIQYRLSAYNHENIWQILLRCKLTRYSMRQTLQQLVNI